MNEQAAIDHASRLRDRVRMHKQAAQHHRRVAQTTMQELERFCVEHRINLIIDTDPGGHSRNAKRAA